MKLLHGMALDRVADRLTGPTQSAVREILHHRRPAIEHAVERLRREHPDLPPRALAERVVARRSEMLAAGGAVSALPGVLPGAGTAVELGAALTDITLLTVSQMGLVPTIAALYQRPLENSEERRLDVLLAMGSQGGVVKLRRDGDIEIMRRRYGRDDLMGEAAERLAERVNRQLARLVAGR